MTIVFPIVKFCEGCEKRLTHVDMTCWNLCNACHKAAKAFAAGLGPEHEQETPDAS